MKGNTQITWSKKFRDTRSKKKEQKVGLHWLNFNLSVDCNDNYILPLSYLMQITYMYFSCFRKYFIFAYATYAPSLKGDNIKHV